MSSTLRYYDSEFAEKVGRLVDDEAVRLVKAMPKWEPGRMNGERVRVKYNLPIRFPNLPENATMLQCYNATKRRIERRPILLN